MQCEFRLDLLQGTLDLLILRTLQIGPVHGWAISDRIQLGRRSRFYRLTALGSNQLEHETNACTRLTAAIGRVLEMA